jgi:predicted Zn-dependent protease
MPRLYLQIASLLERKGDADATLNAHFDYVSAVGKTHTTQLQRNSGFAQNRGAQYVDGSTAQYLQKTKKVDDFLQRVLQRLEKLSGLEREGHADVALGLCRQLGLPEKTVELVDRMDKWGHKARVYAMEKQWAEGAIKMKNATSRADTAMRDQLLTQVENWKKTLNDNPEDYQAALNAYKTYRLLGRNQDAQPFLEKAQAIAPRDPLILDLLAREFMLDKNYAGTVQSLKTAAEIAGRTEDFEGTMLTAFELSGRSQEAIGLALASMAEGRNNGQGLRSVEELLDAAERTDSLKYLYTETKRLIDAEREGKRPVRERLAQLALRLAWDNNDDALAGAALSELMRPAMGGTPVWEDGWRMNQLAQRAVERRRLKDAITIRHGMLQGPDLGAYQALAMLHLQVGEAQQAADLMFDGLTRADQGDVQGPMPVPLPRPMQTRRRGGMPRPQPASEQQWSAAIIVMAAQESAAGGKDFSTACGDRLTELLKAEQERLEKAPAEYSGPLTNPIVEEAFKLRDAVTAAFRTAAQKDDAAPEALIAYARRMAVTVKPTEDEVRDGSEALTVIRKALRDAALKCKGRAKVHALNEAAQIFALLLNKPEKERLAGMDADLVLTTYDQALEADEGGQSLELLRRATDFANTQKRFDRAAKYALALQSQLPQDNEARRLLATAMLNAGQSSEAVLLMKAGLDRFATYSETRAAADLLLSPGPLKQDGTPERPIATEAAAGAAELYARAVTQYLEEVGPQVDAKDRPLPDAELGKLQAQWSRASAAAGKLDDALAQMLAASFNFGGELKDTAVLNQVAEAYAKAGKIEELLARLDEKVTAEPKNVSFRLAQATALEQASEWARAAKALLAARTLDPDLETVKRLISAFRKAGDYESALSECQGWAESFPRDAAAYRTMADIYKELKDEHGEVRSLTMLVEVSPRDADNCRQVAVLFANRKEFTRAIALLERAVEIRGEEAYRHVDLAEVCLMSGDAARAEKILRDALTRDWEKGLSPELLARMPPQRGTYETRAHALLAEACEAQKKTDEATKERLNVPTGYQRPKLEEAVPVARPQPWGGFRMAQGRFRE